MTLSYQLKPLIRYFNQLEDMGDYYKKISVNKKKLIEEFNFMSNVPHELKSFYPEVNSLEIDIDRCSYLIKKIPSHDASHLLLTSQFKECENVLEKIFSYLIQLPQKKCSDSEFRKNVFENIFQKNLARVRDIKNLQEYDALNELVKLSGFNSIQDYCLEINHELNTLFVNVKNRSLIFSHGDLCFSNIILFNDQIFLIDPRGYSGHTDNTFRPIYYDLAKMSQCVFGNYDIINHELFEIKNGKLKFHSSYIPTAQMKSSFQKIVDHFDIDIKTVRMVEASLFLSLIPHHKESKKKMLGFLSNSLAIFRSIK